MIEMVIVLAIVGTLAAMVVPRFAGSIARQRINASARRVVRDLALARQRAIELGTPQTVSFVVAQDKYTLVGLSDLDHKVGDYTVTLSEEPYRADLFSASFGADANVVFDLYGVPDSGGTVVLKVGDNQETVTLDPTTGQAM